MPNATQTTSLRLTAWLTIEDPDMTVEEAIAEATDAGAVVLEVDGRRLKVADQIVDFTEAS